MPGRNYQVGDVFRFRIDDTRYGYGQIAAMPPENLKCFAIFDLATSEDLSLETIISNKILILALSMDAKLDNGEWQIIGHAPIKDMDFALPEYKMLYPNGWVVVDHAGNILRSATSDDLLRLKRMKSFSPAAVEYAVRAHLGLVGYKGFCDELIVDR